MFDSYKYKILQRQLSLDILSNRQNSFVNRLSRLMSTQNSTGNKGNKGAARWSERTSRKESDAWARTASQMATAPSRAGNSRAEGTRESPLKGATTRAETLSICLKGRGLATVSGQTSTRFQPRNHIMTTLCIHIFQLALRHKSKIPAPPGWLVQKDLRSLQATARACLQ